MRRKLFPILSAVSLALAVSLVGLWTVSYWRMVGIQYAFPTNSPEVARMYTLFVDSGALGVGWFEGTRDWIDRDGWKLSSIPRYPSLEPWSRGLWFEHEPGTGAPGLRDDGVYVPLWFLTIFFLIVPTLWHRRFCRLRRRQKLGLCLRCGYDLRATLDHCPECDTPVPADLVRKPMA